MIVHILSSSSELAEVREHDLDVTDQARNAEDNVSV